MSLQAVRIVVITPRRLRLTKSCVRPGHVTDLHQALVLIVFAIGSDGASHRVISSLIPDVGSLLFGQTNIVALIM